jgi:cytidylate kinase
VSDATERAVVAVDGPSGSGKSSVSRGVARALGLRYLDTGAMYRAVTWAALRDGVPLEDAHAVAAVAEGVALELSTDPDESLIRVDGLDVTRAIREDAVTSTVSRVAAVPRVRQLLVARQRETVQQASREGDGIVVEGRDIGSVVLPDADLKVWLVADPEVRAARRAAEDAAAGRLAHSHQPGVVDAVAEELSRRDAADAARASSPTTRADDAVEVDATHLGLSEVIERVVALVRERAERRVG